MALIKRKGDVRKCIPIYVVAAILIICGLPLMITGIVGQFQGADLMGYVGGVCIFFGLGFFLMWHMFTIENVEKNMPAMEYDPDLKDIKDVVLKSRAREMSAAAAAQRESTGFSNLAFVADKSANASAISDRKSQGTNGLPQENVTESEGLDSDQQVPEEEVTSLSLSVSSLMGSHLNVEDRDSTGRSSRNSIPLEVV